MNLNLEESEIKEALKRYVKSKVTLEPGQHLEIEFTSGRNPPTVSARVDIVDDTSETPSDIEDEVLPNTDDDTTPFSDEQTKLPFQEFLS